MCQCVILVPFGDRWDPNAGSAELAVAPMTVSESRNRSHTYRFDVSVHMGPLSSHEDVCESFKEILDTAHARIKLNGLKNCSFSSDVPDEGLAKISGYVQVNKASRLYGSAVRTLILNDRISGEIES